MNKSPYKRSHRVTELTPEEYKRIDQLAVHHAMDIEAFFVSLIKQEPSLSRLLLEENDEEFLAGLLLFKKLISSALRNKLNV